MIRTSSAAVAAALVLAACGGSSSSGAAAPPATPPLSGIIAGQSFATVESSSLVLAQATCSFSGTQASATGILVGIGSFTGLCGLVTASNGCGTKANATIVNLLVVRANVTGQTAGPVQPGTYDLANTTPTPDAQGNIDVAEALYSKTDASCGEPNGTPTATKGTIHITTITSARVAGTADVTFSDGSHVAGAFDAPLCGFTSDVCTALAGGECASRTCVP